MPLYFKLRNIATNFDEIKTAHLRIPVTIDYNLVLKQLLPTIWANLSRASKAKGFPEALL